MPLYISAITFRISVYIHVVRVLSESGSGECGKRKNEGD